jgi:hypothetical protein
MAPSIPYRYVENPVGYIPPRLIELQINAQAKRQNYGKSKQIYSGRNKWSKIAAKQTTSMGAPPLPTGCDCSGMLYFQNGKWYCQGLTGSWACPFQ